MSQNRLSNPTRHQPRAVFTAERRPDDGRGPKVAAPMVIAAPQAPVETAPSSEILAALQRIETKLGRTVEIAPEVDKLQVEISEIAGRIKATKIEMAALRHPLLQENRFRRAADDLAAIVQATERATTDILNYAEKIDEITSELQTVTNDAYVSSRLSNLSDVVMQIYEACNFQDLTGQKIRKVVGALAFIEERVESMVNMWNATELATLPLPPSLERADGDVRLHGPDLSGMSSQADIDALFD